MFIGTLFIKSSKLETAQMFADRWLDKRAVLNPPSGLLLLNKKESTTEICTHTSESQKQLFERKKPDTKENILYNSIYMKFKNKQH